MYPMKKSGHNTPRFLVTVVASTDAPKPQPKRNSYLWANYIVVDDMDQRCPVIEG